MSTANFSSTGGVGIGAAVGALPAAARSCAESDVPAPPLSFDAARNDVPHTTPPMMIADARTHVAITIASTGFRWYARKGGVAGIIPAPPGCCALRK